MLPFPLHQVTESFLLQICIEKWTETNTLDFKALPPKNDDQGKQEFRKDVCAFANGEGGDLVYGISEKDGAANTILPITESAFDSIQRRLMQILDAQVEPRIQGIQVCQCPIAAGGFAMVVRVPASYDGPHRHGPDTRHRFVRRNNSSTSDMTYDQLRQAFGRRASLVERAEQFRAQRLSKIAEGLGPKVLSRGPLAALHFVPLSGIEGAVKIDIKSIHSDNRILLLGDDFNWPSAVNLQGLAMYPYDDPIGVETYSQIFRNGSFEVVRNVKYEIPMRSGHKVCVNGQYIAHWLRSGIKTYAKASSALGIKGPVMIGLSMLRTANTRFTQTGQTCTDNPTLEDRFDLPETWIDDMTTELDLDFVTRPILDVVCQCYGDPWCHLFDAAGKWKL